MLSLSIGPLAFPLPPLLLLAAMWLAAFLARRLAPAALAAQNETSIWLAAVCGLTAARVGHVLRHAEAYAASPASALDIRDGGWSVGPGLVVAAVVVLWRSDRLPEARRALVIAAGSGAALWGLLVGAVQLAQPPADVRAVPPVALRPLQPGVTDTTTLADLLDGRPLVVNLWATWCGPCRAEMPVLAAAQQARPDVRFVFANQGESPEVVLRYLSSNQIRVRDVWLDVGSALGPALGSSGLPTTVFFDADGSRVDAHVGLINAAALQAQLARWPAPPRAPTSPAPAP